MHGPVRGCRTEASSAVPEGRTAVRRDNFRHPRAALEWQLRARRPDRFHGASVLRSGTDQALAETVRVTIFDPAKLRLEQLWYAVTGPLLWSTEQAEVRPR